MVQLEKWQRVQWLQERKRRLKWQEKHPGKFYRSMVIGGPAIYRYTCDFCQERYYYDTMRNDRDAPQYHQHKGKWFIVCHVCWHLKNIYLKHQKEKSFEGLSGCRFCNLQLAAKRARKRSQKSAQENSAPKQDRFGPTESGPTHWEPTGVRGGAGMSQVRQHSSDSAGQRSSRRGSGKVSNERLRKDMAKA